MQRSRLASSEAEIRELLALGDVDIMLELLKNPATPLDVLTTISQSRHFPGAPRLRVEGTNALKKRDLEQENTK